MTDTFDGHFFIFQGLDYLETWRETIGAARAAQLVHVRVEGDGTPLLLAGLSIEKRHGARVLSFPDGGVCDYNAPILFPAGARLSADEMAKLWKALRRALPPFAFDVAILDKMPDVVVGAANPFRFLAPDGINGAGHAVTIEGDWRHFSAHRLHRAKDSRRKRRRLAELGDVRFVVAHDHASAQRLLEAMIALKSRRYLNTRGIDGLDRPGYRAYFRAMTDRFAASGQVHASALEVNGEVVAAHWGLVTQDRFYCLMLSYREDTPAAKYSPGRLLIENLMEWCCDHRIGIFDFGFGEAPWKDFLADSLTPLRRAAIARTLLGWAYLEAADMRRAFGGALRTRSKTPPGHVAPPAPSLS